MGTKLFVLYPLVPWIGVMAVGYALGPVFLLERAARRRRLVGLGTATVAGFVVLRARNLYGDPAPWIAHDSLLATVLSFINCEKYPPSLLYVAMTLGPALLLLAAFDGVRGRVADVITTYGRVPFFYYIAHIFPAPRAGGAVRVARSSARWHGCSDRFRERARPATASVCPAFIWCGSASSQRFIRCAVGLPRSSAAANEWWWTFCEMVRPTPLVAYDTGTGVGDRHQSVASLGNAGVVTLRPSQRPEM